MMFLKYFLQKSPRISGRFVPNTVPGYNYTVRKFLAYLCRKNPGIHINTYKDVLKTVTDAAEDILAEGSSISITGYIKISPFVKGVFESWDDNFKKHKHKIGISCTVLPDFTGKVAERIKPKKVPKPNRGAFIDEITNSETKGGGLHRYYTNSITGGCLRPKKDRLAGLLIALPGGKSIIIEAKNLNIIKHTRKEILFNFRRNIAFPEWLVNGAGIHAALQYDPGKGSIVQYKSFRTNWFCNE